MTTRIPRGFLSQIIPTFEYLRESMQQLAWKLTVFRDTFLNQENRAVLLDRTEAVFLLFEESLSTDITISIARLMDPVKTGSKENLTLWYLFELIREFGNAPDLLSTIEARYQALDHILKPISELRNKVLAHCDRPTALTTPLALTLTAQDIVHVCKEFKGIVNDIDGYFAESQTLFDFQVCFSNIDTLVKYLQRGIQGVDQDNERELQKCFSKPNPG